MKNVYLRSNYSIKKISYFILLSLIPLIIGGFYKNGIKLYNHDLVSFASMFKPLIITLLGFMCGIIVNLIYEYLIKKNKDTFINTIFSSFHPVYGILIASIISINTNIVLFGTITFIGLFISKFLKTNKINVMALIALIITLIISITSEFSFLNVYESTRTLNLEAIDYLAGLGSGGINTTYVIFLIFSLIILANQEYYKRSIALFSFIIFSICMIIYSGASNNIGGVLDNIFANGILFSFIYLAPDSISSSYTRKGKIIFGSLVGLFTFSLFLIYPPLSALGAILIVSILHTMIDKFCLK